MKWVILQPVLEKLKKLLYYGLVTKVYLGPQLCSSIVLLYAFVVAKAGVYLGKIKIFRSIFGSHFVLFAGIPRDILSFTADTHILHFIRELDWSCSYSVSVSGGAISFFFFQKGEWHWTCWLVGIVVLNIAVALGLYFIWEHSESNCWWW